MNRIAVIGCSGSGKSTLSRQLGERLNIPVIHLDRVFWQPGWVEPPRDEFAASVCSAVAGERWILDGNFGNTQHIVRAFVGTRELGTSGKLFGANAGGGAATFIGGSFDTCGADGICTGWAAQSGVTVSIQLDGAQIGTAVASLSRSDVQAVTGYANTGWSFTIPQTVDRTVVHSVRAFVGTRELQNSGKTYGGGVTSGWAQRQRPDWER